MGASKALRRVALATMIGTTVLMAAGPALAAFSAFVAIKGTKQGQFRGESVQEKRKDKWIPVASFAFGVRSPRDMASGATTGKRQFEQVCLVKEWGASDPQIFQAASSNENLVEVTFEFTKASRTGEEYVYETVKLTNASVASMRQFTAHAGDTSSASRSLSETQSLAEVCFTFMKVEINNAEGRTMYVDDWRAAP
jgi:type VI secretion system secreted protein Hcp